MEVDKMSIFPFQINEVVRLYDRVSKLNPSTILEKEQEEPQDIVNISAEARKKQILEKARSQVIERIRKTE